MIYKTAGSLNCCTSKLLYFRIVSPCFICPINLFLKRKT